MLSLQAKGALMVNMAVTNRTRNLRIWQWNCRGIASKKAVLLQLVKSETEKPHVILLQETITTELTLTGYKAETHRNEHGRGVAILIGKKIPYIRHEIRHTACYLEHLTIEIIPNDHVGNKQSIFLTTLYSSPKDTRQGFRGILGKIANIAKDSPLIVGGDFNAPHQAWGYAYPSSKGERLYTSASDLDLTLITDPETPTRCGTSSCRDTTPDLTFVRGIEKCGWYNSGIDLGSDHYVLRINAELPGKKQREYKLIDWDKFRKIRTQSSNSSGENTTHTLASWTEQLKADIVASERTITTDVKVERMDSRLANLLEAKHSILARWKGQRFNRRLRKKLAELNKTIEEYCVLLSRQQWDEVCNSLNGQIRKGSGWRLIKHLLDESGTKSKSVQRIRLSKLVHCATQCSTAEELVEGLAKRYLPLKSGQPRIPQRKIYDGAPNSELDADYTESEVRFAIHELNSNSAAGPDGVTNRALRNLEDNSVTFLTQQINEAWKTGRLPGEWKHANTVLIPKPGKPLGLSNLRPISLTSCIGKLAEHVILNRLSEHVEEKEYFPYTLIGYRPGLSTQDAMLRIKKSLLDRSTRDTKALLGLDVEKAFDNIRHQAILTAISEHNLGTRFYQYVNAFLEDRTATLRIGEHVSQRFDLGDKGTPQGSVLSPFLFNLAMAKLSRALGEIADVEHTIYADDVTIWSTGGSDAELEARMQEAISVTEAHLTPMGLRCSSEKSELLIYHPPRRGRPSKDWRRPSPPCIDLHDSDGNRIPTVDKIRILGLIIQSNGSNLVMLESITYKIGNALRMFRRIMNRHRGLDEDNAIRMVHAFVLCHITYVAAMLNWKKVERQRLEVHIRRAFKAALGLPDNASTALLLQLGVHNPLAEIIEAQHTAQIARLSSTKAGRDILVKLGLNTIAERDNVEQLPKAMLASITVLPFPRNVHPIHNHGRRLARARALAADAARFPDQTAFVDAAHIPGKHAYSVVVIDGHGRTRNSLTLYTKRPEVAEQAAIALALTDSRFTTVYSDSRGATRAFAKGGIDKTTLRILGGHSITDHSIVWFPAHMGSLGGSLRNLNETAHEAARGLIDRVTPVSPATLHMEYRDQLFTYNEITKHFYLGRREFPLPDKKLTRSQSVTLRLLQTNAYPNPWRMKHIDPDYDGQHVCEQCRERVNLTHMLCGCASSDTYAKNKEQWAKVLRSASLADQLRAVQEAREAAESFGLSVPTWEVPSTPGA